MQTVHGAARIDAALAQQREVLALLASGASPAAKKAYTESDRSLKQGLADIDASVSDPEESALAANITSRVADYRKLYERQYTAPRSLFATGNDSSGNRTAFGA